MSESVIQLRRDTRANWVASNPILAKGEVALIKGEKAYKVGNGETPWVELTDSEPDRFNDFLLL